jgi:hypothetical protein
MSRIDCRTAPTHAGDEGSCSLPKRVALAFETIVGTRLGGC